MNEFDDPFGLYRQSVPSGHRDHEGREIRVLGRPILAWNATMNNLGVPDDCRQHQLVADRYYYTLPSKFIDAIVGSVGEGCFDEGLLAFDRR